MSRIVPSAVAGLCLVIALACGGLPTSDGPDFVPVDGPRPVAPADDEDASDDEDGEAPMDGDEPPAPDEEDDTDNGDDGEEEDGAPVDAPQEAPEPPPPPPEPRETAPAPSPPPAPKGAPVKTKGDGQVVLIGGSGRFPVPGNVPPGRYDIEVTFDGASPVRSGKVDVGADGATVQCNADMGICRSR